MSGRGLRSAVAMGLFVHVCGVLPALAELYTQDLTGSRLTLEIQRDGPGAGGGGAHMPGVHQFLFPLDVTGELRLRHDAANGQWTLAEPGQALVRYGRLVFGRLDVLDAAFSLDSSGSVSGYLDARFVATRLGRWLPGRDAVQRFVVGSDPARAGSIVFGPAGRVDTELLAVGPRLRLGRRPHVAARWTLDWRGSGGLIAAPTPTASLLGVLGLVLVARRGR